MENKTKPILVVHVDGNISRDNIAQTSKMLEDGMGKDYYILVLPTDRFGEVEVKSVCNIKPENFEELKKEVLKAVKDGNK